MLRGRCSVMYRPDSWASPHRHGPPRPQGLQRSDRHRPHPSAGERTPMHPAQAAIHAIQSGAGQTYRPLFAGIIAHPCTCQHGHVGPNRGKLPLPSTGDALGPSNAFQPLSMHSGVSFRFQRNIERIPALARGRGFTDTCARVESSRCRPLHKKSCIPEPDA